MHASVIKANEYRAQERARRRHNARKQKAKGFVRLCGLDPRLTPCLNPEGNAKERNIKALPEKRAKRFWNAVINVFYLNSAK